MKSFLQKAVSGILLYEARLALMIFRPKIIAITGSVGKTSTKDAVFCVLSRFFSARKSVKSYNSDFGIPLTILGLKNAAGSPLLWMINILKGFLNALFPNRELSWLVLEVGAGKKGDIEKFAKILSPDIAIITRFADVPVHVEFFASPEEVFAEKTLLASAVPAGGTVILGADDYRVSALGKLFSAKKIVKYGTSLGLDVRGFDYSIIYEEESGKSRPSGISFKVAVGGSEFEVVIRGVIGEHLIQPFIAGLSVALILNLDIAGAVEALSDFEPPAGRMRLVKGINNSVIIDDSYNASPVAMKEALLALASVKTGGRRIAVLGDMAELGSFSADEHQKIGLIAAKSCDMLVVVGNLARDIQKSALLAGMKDSRAFSFEDSKDASTALLSDIKDGDIVLIKGSQSARMERVVKCLMAEPKLAGELLVRQEWEWLKWDKK